MRKDDVIRLLLVDDDEDDYVMFRDLISQIENSNCELHWASSSDEGERQLSTNSYNVCFLDFRLGKRTGLDLLKDAIQSGVKTPIILLTGYGEREVDIEAMRIGAADYLVKDQVNPQLIEKTIRYAIHRKKLADDLKEREAQILVQDRLASLGLLASSLAHEIGTPLGVMRGRAEFIALNSQGNAELEKNIQSIIGQIDRVSNLIRSLLNLARGDHLKQTGRVQLNQVVSEVIEVLNHELLKRGISVKNELPKEMTIDVVAEAGPLHQVLLNLFVNSLQAIDTAVSQGRKENHSIRISGHKTDSHWVLSIQDTGCGISDANLRNLFKPFFTTKAVGVGTGLGLATSYRIVESWGGSFKVESQEGLGSTFKILLPHSV